MNYFINVEHHTHGLLSVLYSDTTQSVLHAMRGNRPVQLPLLEMSHIADKIKSDNGYYRDFKKAWVANSGFGTFVFPIRSGRFCASKHLEMACQISLWINEHSGFDFSVQEAAAEGKRIADNAIKGSNVRYTATQGRWSIEFGNYFKEVTNKDRIIILDGK